MIELVFNAFFIVLGLLEASLILSIILFKVFPELYETKSNILTTYSDDNNIYNILEEK